MKTRSLMLFCILCVAVAIILGSCATMGKTDKMEYVKFCGTWANNEYQVRPSKVGDGSKIIFNPEGTYVQYTFTDDTHPGIVGFYTVEKKWTDDQGNSWYHVKDYSPVFSVETYVLFKLNQYNSVLELARSSVDYPADTVPIDKHSDYLIFYRY